MHVLHMHVKTTHANPLGDHFPISWLCFPQHLLMIWRRLILKFLRRLLLARFLPRLHEALHADPPFRIRPLAADSY